MSGVFPPGVVLRASDAPGRGHGSSWVPWVLPVRPSAHRAHVQSAYFMNALLIIFSSLPLLRTMDRNDLAMLGCASSALDGWVRRAIREGA